MPIIYPRPATDQDRYVLFKIDTEEILNFDTRYPRADGGEISGADPNLVYLLKREPFPKPGIDYDMRSLITTPVPDVENGNWDLIYSSEKRPKEDRKLAVENAEVGEFYRHFTFERLAIETAVAVGLIAHFAIDGQTIPPKWRGRLDKYVSRVRDKVLPNIDVVQQLIQDIEDNDGEPDIAGAPWEAPEEESE